MVVPAAAPPMIPGSMSAIAGVTRTTVPAGAGRGSQLSATGGPASRPPPPSTPPPPASRPPPPSTSPPPPSAPPSAVPPSSSPHPSAPPASAAASTNQAPLRMPAMLSQLGDHRGMVARPDLAAHLTALDRLGEPGARADVVEEPPDVALAHLAPRRPPREEPVVVGMERAAEIDLALGEECLEHHALRGRLSDLGRHEQLRVHVALGAGDVEIAAVEELLAGGVRLGGPDAHRLEEHHLRLV